MLRPRQRKALLCATSFALAALASAPALAQTAFATAPPHYKVVAEEAAAPEPDETGGGVLFYGLGSFGNIHGLSVSVPDGGVEANPLKNKHFRLDGGGTLVGGGFQIDVFGKYVRGGFATSVFGIDGAHLSYDKLGSGFSVKAQSAWGATFNLFLGHEFLKGPVRPYIDLVGSLSVVSFQMDLNHSEYGLLGRSDYEGWLFGFGPRAGVSVPLGQNAFFDLSGQYSIVGLEKFRVVAGIGFWGR